MRQPSRRPSSRSGRRLLALLGAFALILIGVSALSAPAQAATSITNGGFEAGNLSGWTASGAATSVTTTNPHSGTYSAMLGSTSPTNGDSSVAQSFTAPSGGGTLAFWYDVVCPDTVTYDWATVTLADTTAGTTSTPLAKTCVANSGWQQVSVSVVSGHNYTLTLTSHDDNYSTDPTYTQYDDVTLTGSAPPPTGITNGGFETGNLSGWTAAGASESVVNSGAHSGTYAAQLGSTSPTNGDSSISQSFTVPTGSTQLSFWYNITCPDTVTYDWATATLADTTAGTTSTPLAKTCVASSGWQQVTAAVTAGHSYTLTLTSHDDNYSADPTHTLYDDVALNNTSPDFSLSDSPASGSVTVGGSTTTTVSVAGSGGFTGSVALSASGLPAGTTATFNPASVSPGATSTLTLATSSTTPTGTSTVTITGTSGTLTHTASYNLTVNPVATNDFSLSDSPTSGAATQGASTTTTVSTAVASGTAQTVSLSASGLPSGATATFNPASVTAGSSSTLTIATASSTPTGSYTVTITGAYPGGSPSHTATFALTVNAAGGGLQQVSTDPFTDTDAQHQTEVEPDTYAYGNTVVGAFQVGRVFGGGSSDLGWATSTDGGTTWQHGFLSGLTVNQGGTYAQVSDASVAFDPKHNVWMIVGLPIDSTGNALGITVNRSTDGGLTWGSATHAVGFDGQGYDKQWVTCDTTSTSPHYGNCYIEADITSSANAEFMATSTDGGVTWGPITRPAGGPSGLGGQPVVQPNGNVIVPFSTNGSSISAFTSTDGGASWGGVNTVASVTSHSVAGGLRSGDGLPSAEIDAAGKVYVAWQDCRFRSGCPANDIVMSTSTNGTSWSAVTRIPIDAVTSGAEHMIPGLGVDHATSGSTAKLGLYYYFYPNANCTASTCQMSVGFISSADGGTTWGTAQTVGGPMTMAQIANTSQGNMVGDYMSCSVLNGKSVALFAIGKAPTGGHAFDEGMYTMAGGLAMRGGPVRASTGPVYSAPIRTHINARMALM